MKPEPHKRERLPVSDASHETNELLLRSLRLSLASICAASFNLAAERQSKSYCGRANAT